MPTGRVTIFLANSRLDNVLLAVCNDPDPFGAATAFLASRGIGDGDRADVEGSSGSIGNVPVICMTNARKVGIAARRRPAAARTGPAAKRERSKTRRNASGRGRKRS
jgi:hypothetical protein